MSHNVTNSIIKDDQLNASSWLNENYTPQQGRLYNPTSAWCAHNMDSDPTFRIELKEPLTLLALGVQGDPTGNNYPTRLNVFLKSAPDGAEKVVYNHAVKGVSALLDKFLLLRFFTQPEKSGCRLFVTCSSSQ